MSEVELFPLGDSALVVRLGKDFASDPEGALREVMEAQSRVEAAVIPGIIECAPAFTSLGIFFDPAKMCAAGAAFDDVAGWLQARITAALLGGKASKPVRPRTIGLPVCYEAEFAPDLEAVARQAKLSHAEVVRVHSEAKYRVHAVGFAPGFPYLDGLPNELATPRRARPRTMVPAGAVGIGGAQTGVYPSASPGGWNLIGRTPLRLFDPQREPPALLQIGDAVRFRAITRAEFDRLFATR